MCSMVLVIFGLMLLLCVMVMVWWVKVVGVGLGVSCVFMVVFYVIWKI